MSHYSLTRCPTGRCFPKRQALTNLQQREGYFFLLSSWWRPKQSQKGANVTHVSFHNIYHMFTTLTWMDGEIPIVVWGDSYNNTHLSHS